MKLANKHGKAKYECAISKLSKQHIYKLFIDRKRLKNPLPNEKKWLEEKQTSNTLNIPIEAYLFDFKEPGYYDGMANAFEWMGDTIEKPVSMGLIRDLHDKAVHSIPGFTQGFSADYQSYSLGSEQPNKAELSSDVIFLDFPTDSCQTPNLATYVFGSIHNNVREIAKWYLEKTPEDPRLKLNDEEFMKTIDQSTLKKSLKLRLNDDFLTLEQELRNASTPREHFRAIGKLLRKLEVAHVFGDGNQRTYSFLLLNKLLIMNNFPPCILDDPYLFDGYQKYPLETIAEEIENGIKNYLEEAHRTVHEESQMNLSLDCP
jgi:hypothetical protein